MAFYTDTVTSKFSFANTIAAAWDAYKASAQKRATYRKTLNELASLSNRELADLGLHRSQLNAVAYEAAYKA